MKKYIHILDIIVIVGGLAYIYCDFKSPVWYHVRCSLCGYVIADFWTTNKAAVAEWKNRTLPYDSPYVAAAMEYLALSKTNNAASRGARSAPGGR